MTAAFGVTHGPAKVSREANNCRRLHRAYDDFNVTLHWQLNNPQPVSDHNIFQLEPALFSAPVPQAVSTTNRQ